MKAKQPKIYTPTQFAKKYKLSRATVWRWLNVPQHEKRLKMYDARKVVIADNIFVEV